MLLTTDPLTAGTDAVVETIEPAPAPKRRGTLLIVDDEDGPRQSLRVIFKDDYDLLMAEDGPTAIELVQSNDIDVAVLDIRMAGMSGIEVLERLKYVKPDIEAIMMTAFETTDTIRQALRLRACDYINKPFDLATMRAAVSKAMQRRTLESEINSSAEKVQELLAELQNQRIEEQIAKKRGDIYASIIHDINGPLTVISGFVQVLNQRLNRTARMEVEDLEFVKHRLNIVTRQTTNCIEISRRYLDILRNKPGHQSVARVSVNQLLKDLEPHLRVHPSLHENEFNITPFSDDVGVKVNSTDVIQILQNLAVNAFQCSPQPHRVEIGGEVLRAALDLTMFKDGPNDRMLNIESMENTAPLVKFSVRDTGPGIPLEVLPKIFQAYFTTKGPREGTGLGLNIVQRLIREGNGALHCHTQPGEGTTFTVYLPGAELAK
ncbi:MAG: hybrid sensor histidine kinase/response regulator [Verrucomicrobiales bacterium]|nr:hybrid sensor histidine kinase/response regulator [Verrucomicrobiales bacterium]